MRRLLSRLTYANVVATLALFLALSTGGAWAASTLISGSKIKRGTITGKQIRDGSLSGVDLAKASVTADRLAAGVLTQGAKGDTGLKGDTGQKGDTGDRGPSDAYYTELPYTGSPGVAVTSFGPIHSLDLPAGKYVVSGSVTYLNTGGSTAGMFCDVVVGTSMLKRGIDYAPAGSFGQVTVDHAFTLGTATTVKLWCDRDGPGPIERWTSSLSAIRVATLTTS